MATLEVPAGHDVGTRVPRGGSSCASCEYLSEDRRHCSNKYFQKWRHGDTLGAPAASYCCDFWEHNRATLERV